MTYQGDVFMMAFNAEHRNASGIKAGDTLDVTLELDSAPRTVDVPQALAEGLAAQPGAQASFDALSFTLRKEYARQITEAKTEETRERRIAKILASLTEGK
jgi:uncharacterized protein YdeI (YjbR/CyaY-like superfamily)